MSETKTPRTDDLLREYRIVTKAQLLGHARQLEQELSEVNRKLNKLLRMIEISEKADDAKSEAEIACSASFMEALAHVNCEMVEEERDNLKAENEQLRKVCDVSIYFAENMRLWSEKLKQWLFGGMKDKVLDKEVQTLARQSEVIQKIVIDGYNNLPHVIKSK